ncbi:transglycosylase SLT domain-containing protein [Rhodocytophaga aerolata]|uniref:Transglycosylase SLT domain-containing protein n=1 Tax=Rhodocytophaga aerolata TaxID=455078 RepID=A0ABT8REG4_9BACT|nr:transglycosylase SLT domain-containing protein [Rhodocytophaga aerolata]MDO1449578.1 transglycosylase SLT domain-containing protein [Rhodocytophaga aerolata]
MFSNKVEVRVPMSRNLKEYYKPTDWPTINTAMAKTYREFGSQINQAAKLANVPVAILNSFIYIESAGNPKAVSKAGAVGLMQLTPDTATNIIHVEAKAGRLSKEEQAILRKVLGKRLDCILSFKYMNQPLACNNNTGKVVTQQDLLNTEFNLMTGAILLSALIDQHTEGKLVRLDKVVVRYNAGYNYKPQGATVEETIAFAQKKGGAETSNYILKLNDLLGKTA